MSTFKQGTVYKITYTSKDGKESNREIIPLTNYSTILNAIDIGELSILQQEKLLKLLNEYNDYREERISSIFSFSDWMTHTYNKTAPEEIEAKELKYRKFDADNIKNAETL